MYVDFVPCHLTETVDYFQQCGDSLGSYIYYIYSFHHIYILQYQLQWIFFDSNFESTPSQLATDL